MPIKHRQEIVSVPRSTYDRATDVWTNRPTNACLGAQQIISWSNPYWLLGKSSGDYGGPFWNYKMEVSGLPSPIHTSGGTTPGPKHYQTKGILVPTVVDTLLRVSATDTGQKLTPLCPAAPSDITMDATGTTAIARCKPASPVVDASTAVAELVQGVPAIPGLSYRKNNISEIAPQGSRFNANAADNYLNMQFAIAPTVSDVQDLRYAAEHSEKIIAQLERDSGKGIRRQIEVPGSATSSSSTGAFNPVMLGGTSFSGYEVSAGTLTTTTATTTSSRFSGSFTYHLPPKGKWRGNIARLDALYGIKPGFDTAWNVVPFSWLADWYGNMGDVMTNLSAFGQDGLVMNYGYITTVIRTTKTYSGSCQVRLGPNYDNVWRNQPFSMSVSYTVMRRKPATPWGFGISAGSLSPRQVAILAALGFSQV